MNIPNLVTDAQRTLLAKIPLIYTSERHKLAIGRVKADLCEGKTSSADSMILMNALWDAVFDSNVYANEMAAVFSILDRAKSGEL
jgi:hypothetical protein